MTVDRRRVVIGFWMTFVGVLLAIVVAGIIPTPAPPACNTDVCNAAYSTAYAGLALLLVGLGLIASGVFRADRPGTAPGAPPSPAGYSFTGAPPAPFAPLPGSAPAPPASAPGSRRCPGCGSTVTAEYGFCPRCGRTLS